ncbi:succinylglutamate desuccinylase [Alteromonas pelagimontana]|nr:succinylglutamate desuccinylase [Alteromonas pelagimontana]
MERRLLDEGEFLALSRFEPQSVATPKSYLLSNGTTVSVFAPGIICFEPAKRLKVNKHIVISCGIHGNETAPIEICDSIVKELLTESLRSAHRVLFLFGNLPAMDVAERFISENMNRLFSGAHSQGAGLCNEERRRAKILEDAVTAFFAEAPAGDSRHHYDLHTAIRESKNEKFAVYPFLHSKPHSRSQLAFLAACGVKTILLSESPTTTFSYYSSFHHGAHAFTVELGKVRPFGHNDMSRFADAQFALTALLTEEDYAPTVKLEELEIFRVNQVINRQQDDFVLHFADDLPNFTAFSKGAVLATESGATYSAEQDGEAIVFPNANVAIGQRALLTVVPARLETSDV